MNCLIVDDETLAQEVLVHYISRIDYLVLAGRCDNALQAFATLNSEPVDLMFLDIKMPEMSGIDLIKSLKKPPMVILTTAYDNYALEGYELNIVDYLLKPIRFERFLKAVDKTQQLQHTLRRPVKIPAQTDKTFYVRSDRKLVQIDTQKVSHIESLKNYMAIHTESKKIICHMTLSAMEAELASNPYFIRIHKSFIVNSRFVTEVGPHSIRLRDNSELPIGLSYKDRLIQSLRIMNT